MFSVSFVFLGIFISLCFLTLLCFFPNFGGDFACFLLVMVMLFLCFPFSFSLFCLLFLSSTTVQHVLRLCFLRFTLASCWDPMPELPYMALIREICGDGTLLYGVEIELPVLVSGNVPRRLFLWSNQCLDPVSAYDHAALQAVCCLQSIYGFVILDYSFERLVSYATATQGRYGSTAVNSQLFADVQRLLRGAGSVHCYFSYLFL